MKQLRQSSLVTPIGPLLIVVDEQNVIRAVDWLDCEVRMDLLLKRHYIQYTKINTDIPFQITQAFQHYFAGHITALDGLETATGGTDFQRQVWQALREIPAGKTCSYGELAMRLGRPTGARAVGMANGLNPISLVVPCHRVIGANQQLTGYAGGLARKQWLLAHEKQGMVSQK
jgi:methylated-DNA-[protein]-cysteine S-methyltransferase